MKHLSVRSIGLDQFEQIYFGFLVRLERPSKKLSQSSAVATKKEEEEKIL